MSDKESTELVSTEDMALLERVITAGDLGSLKAEDRLKWYVARCRSCGLESVETRILSIGLGV